MSATANPLRGGQRQAGVFGVMPMGTVVEALVNKKTVVVSSSEFTQEKVTAQSSLLDARTLGEKTKNERDQILLARLKETVAEVEPMKRAVYDSMVSTRSELLSLPDRLTPLVTPETDAGKIHMMIESEVTRMCDTLRDKLQLLILQNAPGSP